MAPCPSLALRFLTALHFAARAHDGQATLGGLPYVVHLSCVAMELMCAFRVEPGRDEELAVSCALLHDVVEDTPTPLDRIERAFGSRVAAGVSALTKNPALPKHLQMRDSLERIRQQPIEIAMVKLADRITNTDAPPSQWTLERVTAYRVEAQEILDSLGVASHCLSERLRFRIAGYRRR